MGSNNYYGDANLGLLSSSSSSSSSSSRKGKKGNSDKPKQPQRGLGVAQLEKIRLHSQLASNYLHHSPSNYAPSFNQEDMRPQTPYSSSSSPNYSYGYLRSHDHGVVMGMQDIDRANNIRYGDTQSSGISRWNNPGNAGMGTQHYVDPIMTRPFIEPIVEGSIEQRYKKGENDWMGLMIRQSTDQSSSSEEIDLELKL